MLDRAKFAAGLLVLLCTSCASQTKIQDDPLPFRVGILPVEVSQEQYEQSADHDLTDLQLALDSDAVTRQLQVALDGRGFADAVLLDLPQGEDGAAFSTASASYRNEHWHEQAKAQSVDLIVSASLAYDPRVYTATNDRFWLNLPLFLLGGPMTWFVNDRSYFFDAHLSTRIIEVSRIPRAGRIFDASAKLVEFEPELTKLDFDFQDRAGGNLGAYALSIFVPSGFLAKEGPNVLALIEKEIVTRLSERAREEAHRHGRQIVQATSNFSMDDARSRLVRVGGGYELRAVIELEAEGGGAEDMEVWTIYGEDNRVLETGFFEDGPVRTIRRGGQLVKVYELVQRLEAASPQGVRLELEDSREGVRFFRLLPGDVHTTEAHVRR